jgi:hypothetical protein
LFFLGICGAVKIVEMEWEMWLGWLVVDRGIFGWLQCSCTAVIDDGYGVTSPNGNKFGIAPDPPRFDAMDSLVACRVQLLLPVQCSPAFLSSC